MNRLEGKITGVTANTLALKSWNGIDGPGCQEPVTGAVPQYGFRVMEEGKKRGTKVFFNAFNNIQRGAFVVVSYENEDGSKMAYKIDVLEKGKVVERYLRDH